MPVSKDQCLAARLGAVDTTSLVFTQDGKFVGKTKAPDPVRIEGALDALVEHRKPELAD